MRQAGLASLLFAFVVACGSSSSKSAFDPDASTSSSSGGASSGGAFGGPGDGGGPGADGCTDAAKLVYVVSQENDLYSFAPDKLTFVKIGPLSCPSGSNPNSMAVDRSGTAWVNFSDGSLFKVSTTDASCQATNFQPGQAGFGRFGMAFATNAAGSLAETLFVSGITGVNSGQGLAKIDMATLKLATLGDYSGSLAQKGAELTGTGDGRLYGFFTTVPNATLAQIDEHSAATSGVRGLAGVSTGQDWAFSFWGGDFWFYTSDGLSPSQVTRLKASSDNSLSVVKADVGGFKIVGAGVSTCAPTTPVN